MPQGEIIQIPLTRYIGRQNNAHVVIHFDDCEPDLGRKGFHKDVTDFSKSISAKLVDKVSSLHKFLRPTTGEKPDLKREEDVTKWKQEMLLHEDQRPLRINNPHFFLPTNQISITSEPTREQDVIALFNQLLAGGVVRGVRVMSTNERLTYDALYRIIIDFPLENHLYDASRNPLGILEEVHDQSDLPLQSHPRVLEYKYSLDGLMEDIETGIKNSNDINLVVVWTTGSVWQKNYKITSLLNVDYLSERQYHGVTHVVTNLNTKQREMDLIVLEELIRYLNDPVAEQAFQLTKYDE